MVHRVPGSGTSAAPREEQYLRQFGSVDDLMGLSLDTTLELVAPLRRRVDLDAASSAAPDRPTRSPSCAGTRTSRSA